MAERIIDRGADFSTAFMLCKAGYRIRREIWDIVTDYVATQHPDAGSANIEPYLYNVSSGRRVPWTPTSVSLFARDWIVYEEVSE